MSTTVQTYKRRGSTIWLNKREYRGYLIGNIVLLLLNILGIVYAFVLA